VKGPRFPGKKIKKYIYNFPKLGIQHAGEIFLQICRFWAVNCTKMRLVAGLRRTRWGSYSAPPDSLAIIRGRGGERKGWE